MTGGGGRGDSRLFVFLISLLITTVVAIEKCSKPPSWTINDVDLVRESNGHVTVLVLVETTSLLYQQQVLGLETLQQDLRNGRGIYDVSFIVVNLNKSPNRKFFDEIQSKLSFPIYQEPPFESIWNIMNGQLYDVFIFDRCGRLTFSIPFNRNKLQTELIDLRNLITLTYFGNLCGAKCPYYNQNDIRNGISNNIISNEELHDETDDTDEVVEIEDDVAKYQNNITENNITKNDYTNEDEYNPIEDYNDYNPMDDYNKLEDYNTSSSTTLGNISNEIVNSTYDQNISIQNSVHEKKSFFKSFVEYFMGIGKSKNNSKIETNTTKQIITNDIIYKTSPEKESMNNNNSYENTETSPSPLENNDIFPIIKKNDFCDNFDKSLCLEWRKTKLLQAQKCCHNTSYINGQNKSCKNLGRKRCKKLQPVLKCCLGTDVKPDQQKLDQNTI